MYIYVHTHFCLKQDQITKWMLSFEKGSEAFVMFEAEVYFYLLIYKYLPLFCVLREVYSKRSKKCDHFGVVILNPP